MMAGLWPIMKRVSKFKVALSLIFLPAALNFIAILNMSPDYIKYIKLIR